MSRSGVEVSRIDYKDSLNYWAIDVGEEHITPAVAARFGDSLYGKHICWVSSSTCICTTPVDEALIKYVPGLNFDQESHSHNMIVSKLQQNPTARRKIIRSLTALPSELQEHLTGMLDVFCWFRRS